MKANEILKERDYWRERCELAEKYIKESPCDPDIYPDQLQAYQEWKEFKRTNP